MPGVAATDMLRAPFASGAGTGVEPGLFSVDWALAMAWPVSSRCLRSESVSTEPPAGPGVVAGVPNLSFRLVGALTLSLIFFGAIPILVILSSNQSCSSVRYEATDEDHNKLYLESFSKFVDWRSFFVEVLCIVPNVPHLLNECWPVLELTFLGHFLDVGQSCGM